MPVALAEPTPGLNPAQLNDGTCTIALAFLTTSMASKLQSHLRSIYLPGLRRLLCMISGCYDPAPCGLTMPGMLAVRTLPHSLKELTCHDPLLMAHGPALLVRDTVPAMWRQPHLTYACCTASGDTDGPSTATDVRTVRAWLCLAAGVSMTHRSEMTRTCRHASAWRSPRVLTERCSGGATPTCLGMRRTRSGRGSSSQRRCICKRTSAWQASYCIMRDFHSLRSSPPTQPIDTSLSQGGLAWATRPVRVRGSAHAPLAAPVELTVRLMSL